MLIATNIVGNATYSQKCNLCGAQHSLSILLVPQQTENIANYWSRNILGTNAFRVCGMIYFVTLPTSKWHALQWVTLQQYHCKCVLVSSDQKVGWVARTLQGMTHPGNQCDAVNASHGYCQLNNSLDTVTLHYITMLPLTKLKPLIAFYITFQWGFHELCK